MAGKMIMIHKSKWVKFKRMIFGYGIKESLVKLTEVRSKANSDIQTLIADISLCDDQWLLVPKKELEGYKRKKRGNCQ